MTKIVALVLAGLLLTGCVTTNPDPALVREKIVVVRPDGSFYYCPDPRKFTESEMARLTERDVAKLIAELRRNNMICKRSLDAIKRYLDRAAAAAG